MSKIALHFSMNSEDPDLFVSNVSIVNESKKLLRNNVSISPLEENVATPQLIASEGLNKELLSSFSSAGS